MSSQYPLSMNAESYRLPFYIRYKRIYPDPRQSGGRTYYLRTSLRTPPKTKEAFLPSDFSDIFAWTPGALQSVQQQEKPHLKHYKTSSVYWCPSHQTYLAVDYDCTEESVRDREKNEVLDDWARLTFTHEHIGGQCVSVLGHRYSSEELAAEAPPLTWKTELIPDAHQRQSSPEPPGSHGPSLLAGDLSLLLGLAAISSPDDPGMTIQQCFRPDRYRQDWVPHGKSRIARDRGEHGIVMRVLYDPREVNGKSLEEWEAGYNGPILK